MKLGGDQAEDVILVVGSCGLDRLLTTSKYPIPDSKVRSIAYNEVGGGNAANTASAMALLQNAGCWSRNVRVQLLSKVGDDLVGTKLVNELQGANVDTQSPLFRIGPPGSSTAVTTILVELEGHTRTCIHTPGTCGDLTIEEIEYFNMDDIFKNVIHLHSDSRHTDAALRLSREAKRRGIPVSVDCEKDRKNTSLDALLELSDIVFTNSNCLDSYLGRLESELEAETNRNVLPEPSMISSTDSLQEETLSIYAKSLAPSAFFTRWYSQMKKQVIVTQ
jgi:sugar/nucleoside kinase (ribokinase family)